MTNASHAAMQEALRRRKQGIDLTIILGSPDDSVDLEDPDTAAPGAPGMLGNEDEEETKELGQAPEATTLEDEPDPTADPTAPPALAAGDQGLPPLGDELRKAPLGRGSMLSRMKGAFRGKA